MAAGGLVLGFDGGAGAAPRTLQYTSRTVDVQLLDEGAPGRSVGDRVIQANVLLDGAGRTIGRDVADCTQVTFDGGSGEFLCTDTTVLGDGQFVAAGLVDERSLSVAFEGAVTGGTGAYAGASGVASVRVVGGGDRAVTVRFVR